MTATGRPRRTATASWGPGTRSPIIASLRARPPRSSTRSGRGQRSFFSERALTRSSGIAFPYQRSHQRWCQLGLRVPCVNELAPVPLSPACPCPLKVVETRLFPDGARRLVHVRSLGHKEAPLFLVLHGGLSESWCGRDRCSQDPLLTTRPRYVLPPLSSSCCSVLARFP